MLTLLRISQPVAQTPDQSPGPEGLVLLLGKCPDMGSNRPQRRLCDRLKQASEATTSSSDVPSQVPQSPYKYSLPLVGERPDPPRCAVWIELTWPG